MVQLAKTIGSWFGKLRKHAGRLGVSPGDDEDVAQIATLRLVQAEPWLARLERPEGGARKVLRHEALRALENERRRGELLTSFDERLIPDERLSPEAPARRRQQRDLLANLLKRVDKPDRRLLVMHDLWETPLADIATQRNLKLETVKTQYRRARARFAEAKAEWKAAEEKAGRDGQMPCVPVPLYLGHRRSWRAVLREFGPQVVGQAAFALLPAALLCAGDSVWSRTNPPLQPIAVRTSGDAAGSLVAPEPIRSGAGASRGSVPTDAPAAPREARGETREQATPHGAGTPSTTGDAGASLPGASAVENRTAVERSLLRDAKTAIEDDTPAGDIRARRLLDQHRREFPRGRFATERENLLTLLRDRANRESGP
jgi:RNA polymerase sigma-70 factor, ECF subfamily